MSVLYKNAESAFLSIRDEANCRLMMGNRGMMDNHIRNLIKDDMSFVQEGNVCHFISDEALRPGWSKALDDYLTGSHINLMIILKN